MNLNDPPLSIKKLLASLTLTSLIITFLTCALVFTFSDKIENYIMRQLSTQQLEKKPTIKTEEQKAKEPEPTYDIDSIESVTAQDVINAANSDEVKSLNPDGELAVPSAGIHMPIYEGVSLWALLVGAGEQMPRNIVKNGGIGNYILAGHNVMDYGTLFSTLHVIKPGDPIYTFDGDNLYTYIADSIELFEKSQSTILNQVKDKSIITLYTCGDMNATTRFVVQGHLEKTTPKDKISEKDMEPFQLANNAYSGYTAQYLYHLWYGL